MAFRCIVTGFDAFGGEASNPSQLAVQQVPDSITGESGQTIPVVKDILATCCRESWEKLSGLLPTRGDADTFLLMAGWASKRNRISLERFALNIRDYRIADNQGHQPLDQQIIDGAPDARKTSLNLPELLDRLDQSGYLCEISNFAGAFVCNEVYYRSLAYQQDHANLAVVLFIHLPPPAEYAQELITSGKTKEKLSDQEVLSLYAALLQDIARYCCDATILPARTEQG